MYRKSATAVVIFCLALTLRADPIGSVGGSGGGSQPIGGSTDPIVGTTDDNNCVPFTCVSLFGGITTYQQVYSSTAFPGVTPFNQINFFLSPVSSPVGDLDSGTYDIYFSYTSKPIDGLSFVAPSDNIGADYTLFGAYTLPGGSAPSTLTFNGNTFDYNPTMGNLLMTIDISGAVDGIIAGYDSDDTGTVTSRAWFGGNGTLIDADIGLVTGFSAVPEPSGVVLLITAVACVGLKLRKGYRHTS
jgi:hypothetical protein